VAATAGRVLRAPDIPAGATILHAFETPRLTDDGSENPCVTIAAAGMSAGWRRAALQYSLDGGGGWTALGGTGGQAVIGRLVAPIAPGPTTLIDSHATIDVALAHAGMTLANADGAALDRGGNLALVGDELLQFGSAQPLGGGDWRLTSLWRGRRGSIAQAAAAGTRFVLLDGDSLMALRIDAAIGSAVRISASGVGDAMAVESDCFLSGRSVLPPAPVRLTGRIQVGMLTLYWRRRSRTDWRWRDSVEAALGEEREAYSVTIATATGERAVETAEPRLVMALAAIGGAPLHAAVRQIGSHGLSPPAILIF
jgi:hypothetical protein